MMPVESLRPLVADFDDDDAGLVGLGRGLHGELGAQVDHDDDLPAEVDHALDVGGRAGQGGDVHPADDFADLEDFQAVLLLAQGEGEVLAATALVV